MPVSARSFTPHAVKARTRHGHALSQGAVIHLGSMIAARYLSQQVKSPLAKSVIYTARHLWRELGGIARLEEGLRGKCYGNEKSESPFPFPQGTPGQGRFPPRAPKPALSPHKELPRPLVNPWRKRFADALQKSFSSRSP